MLHPPHFSCYTPPFVPVTKSMRSPVTRKTPQIGPSNRLRKPRGPVRRVAVNRDPFRPGSRSAQAPVLSEEHGRMRINHATHRTSCRKYQCSRGYRFPVVCRSKLSVSKTAKRMAGSAKRMARETTALGRSGRAEAFNSLTVGQTSGCTGQNRKVSSPFSNERRRSGSSRHFYQN